MDKNVNALNKRLKGDKISLLVIAGLMCFFGCAQIIKFILDGDVIFLKRGVQGLVMMVPHFILFWILRRIALTGKPFDDKVVRGMRLLAISVIAAGVLPFFIEAMATVVKGDMFSFEINVFDLFIPLTGLIIGIISEIFVYGKELQEDNDLIA